MRPASLAYRPRQPDADVLHRLVRDHFETLRERARGGRDDEGLPAFVEREFREFLTCGRLAAGFARFRCRACGTDRLVAFSCKGRGFCPSCGGRRMTERAAHLVDHVFPAVPIRQWVLTLPVRLRYALAFDHAACRDVAAAFLGAVFAWLRSRARRHGVNAGQTGAVVIVQRFGGAVNLNVHLHVLVLDGVFAPDGAGRMRFWSLDRRAVVAADLAALLTVVRRRVLRRLELRGRVGADDAPDQWADTEPVLAGLAAASVAGVAASGRRRGAPVRRWGDAVDRSEPLLPGRWQARIEGFDLHAGLVVPARARDRLERLCRYALRPPSVAMIAAAAALIWRANASPPTFISSVTRGEARSPTVPAEPIDISGLNVLGAETARVVIIEFADFQCPFCVRFFEETLPELRARYIDTGRVRFVLRHLPLERVHAQAEMAAVAAECAGREARFWEMHDSLFNSRGELGMNTLVGAAAGLGIGRLAFTSCLNEPEHQERLRRDIQAASTLGISGTPTFYLGVADNRSRVSVSRVLVGIQSFERFKTVLEAIMGSLQP